jgi:hypothetical protein
MKRLGGWRSATGRWPVHNAGRSGEGLPGPLNRLAGWLRGLARTYPLADDRHALA